MPTRCWSSKGTAEGDEVFFQLVLARIIEPTSKRPCSTTCARLSTASTAPRVCTKLGRAKLGQVRSYEREASNYLLGELAVRVSMSATVHASLVASVAFSASPFR